MPDGKPSDTQTPRQIDSAEILKGHQEVLIQHGDKIYRLRVTKNGKLILCT